MRVLAFYLPQYHPIPENDEGWGAGYTDWQKVAAARPRFKGHHQPHVPADLGFYDLRLEETRLAQAALAAQHGIGGFCYYHYWFNGRLLLGRPFDEVLASGRPHFPFCLCWANENWTRRWDGLDQEILIQQDYDAYDPAAHIEWLEPAFRDQRYIKIHGQPLFLVYRPDDIPKMRQIIDGWRSHLENLGYPGLYLAAVETKAFTRLSPDETFALGFDAIVEFQPNPQKLGVRAKGRRTPANLVRWLFHKGTDMLGLEHVQRPRVTLRFDYRVMVEAALARPRPTYKTFPCVMPSWDNTARKRVATIIQNDDPELYLKWLRGAIQQVADYDEQEQIVFINAWNEWAEGCHLEPDLRIGRRFLEATRRVILGAEEPQILTP